MTMRWIWLVPLPTAKETEMDADRTEMDGE
jgi:hypothetical protein